MTPSAPLSVYGSLTVGADIINQGGVLRAPAVRAYWEAYKLTDVRPRVIKTGEMRLSRTLKGAVMSPREFVALYSATRFAAQVEHDDALLHFAMRNGRSANINHWKRITPKAALDYLSTRFLVPFNPAASFEQPKPKQFRKPEGMPQASLAESAFVADYDDFVKFVHNRVGEAGNINETALRSMTAAYAAEVFMEGSQIHQNAAILLAIRYLSVPMAQSGYLAAVALLGTAGAMVVAYARIARPPSPDRPKAR